ncbi:MAG: hypothetical protein B7Y89_16510, partial [Novosphingobium sp. 32-60-15]
MVFAQTAFGQAVELPNVANANGAMIGTSLTSPTMTVNADGANRVIDWNTFSIGATGVVDFVSRNTMTNVTDTTTPLTVVNRVIGTSNGLGAPRTFTPSLINGKIVNRRPNGTHYRRAKGNHLAAWRWVDGGRGFRA